MKFYVTFGAGCSLHDKFMEIQADDYNELHKWLEEQYHGFWVHAHTEASWKENKLAEKNQLTEVKFGTECEALPQYGEEPITVPDCSNQFAVALVGRNSVILGKPPGNELSKFDAFLIAAWLCHMAQKLDGDLEFGDVLNAVEALDFEEGVSSNAGA